MDDIWLTFHDPAKEKAFLRASITTDHFQNRRISLIVWAVGFWAFVNNLFVNISPGWAYLPAAMMIGLACLSSAIRSRMELNEMRLFFLVSGAAIFVQLAVAWKPAVEEEVAHRVSAALTDLGNISAVCAPMERHLIGVVAAGSVRGMASLCGFAMYNVAHSPLPFLWNACLSFFCVTTFMLVSYHVFSDLDMVDTPVVASRNGAVILLTLAGMVTTRNSWKTEQESRQLFMTKLHEQELQLELGVAGLGLQMRKEEPRQRVGACTQHMSQK
jgi:hypothetical protein